MRQLLVLRGIPCSGKTSFIKDNNLGDYTISVKKIRLLYRSNFMYHDGSIKLFDGDDNYINNIVFDILEKRMQNGLFTVLDDYNVYTETISKLYQLCNKMRYEMTIVDFSGIDIKTSIERNFLRDVEEQVSEKLIQKLYNKLNSQKLPNTIRIIKPSEFNNTLFTYTNMDKWNAINFIGDIHGCFSVLNNMLKDMKDDEFYVFCGDYLDRGSQNVETIKVFINELQNRNNVMFLEGNHERHLFNWINGDTVYSETFMNSTKPELEKANLSKKKLKKFCKNLKECAYFEYNNQYLFSCHGGLPTIPEVLSFLPAKQYIKGVGNYEETANIENTFYENHKNNEKKSYLIHGHRNRNNIPIQANPLVFNLEGSVEFGGELRMVTFFKNGQIKCQSFK